MTDAVEPPPAEHTPRARFFVIRLPGEAGKTSGYVVAEEVAYVDATHGGREVTGRLLLDGIEGFFERGKDVTVDALAIPAERDPRGGYRMLTSVHGTSVHPD